MNMKPRELLRKGEDDYKIFNLNDSNKSDEEILKIMSENPKLIERPIVVTGNKAVIGRPPENIFKIKIANLKNEFSEYKTEDIPEWINIEESDFIKVR